MWGRGASHFMNRLLISALLQQRLHALQVAEYSRTVERRHSVLRGEGVRGRSALSGSGEEVERSDLASGGIELARSNSWMHRGRVAR